MKESKESHSAKMTSGFPTLLRLAVDAARSTDESARGYDFKSRPLTAIVMGAAACECFVNDLLDVADSLDPHIVEAEEWSRLQLFGAVLEEMDRVSRKQEVIVRALTGQRPDLGREPFQSFDRLISLRNRIVHFKQSFMTPVDQEGSRLFNVLHDKQIVRFIDEGRALKPVEPALNPLSMENVLSTRKMAFWACETAIAYIEHLASLGADNLFSAGSRDVCRTVRRELGK